MYDELNDREQNTYGSTGYTGYAGVTGQSTWQSAGQTTGQSTWQSAGQTAGQSTWQNAGQTTGQTAGQSAYAQSREKKKKKNPVLKFFALVFSGLLFGCCAGLAIVVILRLFPSESGKKSATSEPRQEVEIEQARPVLPETYGNDADEEASEVSDEQDATGEKVEGSEPAEDEKTAGAAAGSDETGTDQESLAVVTDVTKVVENVMPAVVSIFGTYEVTQNYWGFELQSEQDGSGSGIILGQNDEELLVVTNNHVVKDSTSLSVQFIDNETYSAVVKGTDSDSDLAVISIKMTDLKDATKSKIKFATMGDSDSLKVGEPAIAIGNALGYGQSVTTGVISAVNRRYSQDEDGKESFLIQTDAAINPGNSGGALLNIYGEVIGINSNKIGGMVVEGMGYAIPISTARPILESLMQKKTRVPVDEKQRGYLGISGINVTEDVKATYGLPIGVYLAQVFDGTPAQRAGLKKGDIIVSFDGEDVATMEELSKLLDATPAGTEVELGVCAADEGYSEEEKISVVLDSQW